MKIRMQPGKRVKTLWLLLFPALVLAGCASTQPDIDAVAAQQTPKMTSERAAAVADIRRKAEIARNSEAGPDVNVYQSYGPAQRSERMTYGEIRAIQAELDALAEATKRSSDPGEIAALRKKAAELEALRDQADLDGETGSGSKSE